jgi:superfamily II DNA or RNA helicase
MGELKLRGYQDECISSVFKAWADDVRRPAVVLPTGAGKTVVFAALIKEFRKRHYDTPLHHKGLRVIVLVHRDELADQAMAKIRSIAPELSVGKVKAESDEITADVMVCSVQTLASERRMNRVMEAEETHGRVGLVITDECHHGAAPTYQLIYGAFSDALHLGVTATMARGDQVGLGSVWDEVVYTKSVLWMISKGHLTDVRAQRVDVAGLDMGGVKASRGDYQAGSLGHAMEDSHADEVIARAYKEHASDRPGVVFTPTVDTAHSTAESMNKAGITTEVISGETPRDERLGIFERFRTGETQVLANCMVLTEGFDAPWASCAVIARPTQSQPLYVQMVGRVLRPWPGKKDALVLDVSGAGGHKLRTLVDLEPGAVEEIEEGETLADAVVREAEAANQPAPRGSVAFALKSRDLDLFAASDKAWLRTPAGVLFISCGDVTVFLWAAEQKGLWDVCTAVRGHRKWRKDPVHQGLDLGSAMAWGEAVAEDHQEFQTTKKARWRKGPQTERQVSAADRMGLDVSGKNSGETSDIISVAVASRTFDGYALKNRG